MLHLLSPIFRAIKNSMVAVGRSLSAFLGAGWPGLTLGFLGATLGFYTLMGAFFRSILWRPLDGGLALGLASIAVLGAALVLRTLRWMFRAWPVRFMDWGLGALLAGAGLSQFIGIAVFDLLGVAVLAAVAGGAGLGLAVLLRRTAARGQRMAGGLLLLAGVLGAFALVRWLRSPGTDGFLETQQAASGPPVPALDLPDPSLPGPCPVTFLAYGSGADRHRPEFGARAAFRTASVDASPFLKDFTGFSAAMRKRYWGFGKDAFPINGRVWTPEGPGPFPLVLCVHGSHTAREDSDLGYAYLGERLASRGFIFVSVDENFLNGLWKTNLEDENAVRGWMLLKHLEVWRDWNARPGHPFRGKVDLDRICLMGHSRGGESVAIAAAYNALPCWPEDARQEFRFGFRIRSVIALAPCDGQYETCGVPTPVRNVDYLVLQGSHDSDVSTFNGQRTYRRVAFTDGKPHFKTSLYFHRANHGQFNTVWGVRDLPDPYAWLLARGALLSGEDQRRIALVTIGAFLEASLKDRQGYTSFLRDPRRGSAWLPRTITFSQYEDETFRPLATFDEDIDPCSTTAPGGRIEASGLTTWREQQVCGRDNWSFRHKGAWLGWARTEGAPAIAVYSLSLPPAFAQTNHLDGSTRLVLTLADTDETPEAGTEGTRSPERQGEGRPKEPVDFTVELVAMDGRTAALPLSALRPLQPVLKVTHSKLNLMEEAVFQRSWEPVFQTFELPLGAFEKVAPGFRAEQLRTLRLRFDRSPRGVVILDQVGFSNER